MPERSWLCVGGMHLLTELREANADVKLVHSRRREKIEGSLEAHAARLAELGVDAMNMHFTDWTAGLVALFHRFGLRVFSWDLQHVRHLARRAGDRCRRGLLEPRRPHGRDRHRMAGLTRRHTAGVPCQSRPMLRSGQMRTKTRPITADFSIEPK